MECLGEYIWSSKSQVWGLDKCEKLSIPHLEQRNVWAHWKHVLRKNRRCQQTKHFSVLHEASIRVRATRAVEIPQIIHQKIEKQWLRIQLIPQIRFNERCSVPVPKQKNRTEPSFQATTKRPPPKDDPSRSIRNQNRVQWAPKFSETKVISNTAQIAKIQPPSKESSSTYQQILGLPSWITKRRRKSSSRISEPKKTSQGSPTLRVKTSNQLQLHCLFRR